MTALVFLFLAGLTALGFLSVIWRRRQMPFLLRAMLIIAAVTIVAYVAWTISALRLRP